MDPTVPSTVLQNGDSVSSMQLGDLSDDLLSPHPTEQNPPPNEDPLVESVYPTPSNDADVFVADLAAQITSLSAHPSNVQGHFCDLFTALHPTEGIVALKRPRISLRNQESTVIRRFLREANTWRAMQHPNVLRFLGACKIDGSIYLVSPYMRNGTVVTFIRNHPEKANRIQLIREIAAALEYLHSQNAIHGNIKGTNILISDREHALLCDFGLARMEDTNTSTTMKGVGTLRWQAPELWDNVPKSFKTDVYAFAMTIAEIFSGNVPFLQFKGDIPMMRAVIAGKRPDREPMNSPNGVSYEWVWQIAAMCWHQDPSERPPMLRVTSLLDCRPVSLVAPMVPHANVPMRSFSTAPRYPTPFISPQDPFPRLSPDILSIIFCRFSFQELVTGSRVCRLWNFRISTDPAIWATKLREAGLWRGGVPEAVWVRRCFKLRTKRPCSSTNQILHHPYKTLFKLRFTTWRRWTSNNPKETRVHLPKLSLYSEKLLRLFRGRIITLFDRNTISLRSPFDPQNVQLFKGHNNCIWEIDICSRRRRIPGPPINSRTDDHRPEIPNYHDLLVSGSWDRTVRIWDLQTQRNTHMFTGHRSAVWCVAVARPVWVEVDGRPGVKEKWPKHHMLVSGDGYGTLMMWRVPGANSPEYHGADKDENVLNNPYYVQTLEGHTEEVKAIVVYGRIIASGSWDKTVRIWDLVTGECKHTLIGHRDIVDSVALDHVRNRVFSASEDEIRIWSLENGSALGVLEHRASYPARLSLSTNTLVSALDNGNLHSWDLAHIDLPARVFRHSDEDPENDGNSDWEDVPFYHDDDKIIQNCKRGLKIWNARDGTLIRRMVTGGYADGIASDRRFCVATTVDENTGECHLHVWDFAGDRGANENRGAGDGYNGDTYDENCLAEEDAEFSDSDEEGEGWE